MVKAIGYGVLALTMGCPSTVSAASVVLRPDSPLSALAGVTIGWGYDITADVDWNLEFLGSFVDLPANSGQLIDLFDFPVVPAGTSVQRDYDPSGPSGLVELTLSPLLSPGDTVIGRIFLDYLRIDPLGLLPDETGVFELQVSAVVASPTAVPEPTSLLLFGTAIAALAGRRRQRALFTWRRTSVRRGDKTSQTCYRAQRCAAFVRRLVQAIESPFSGETS